MDEGQVQIDDRERKLDIAADDASIDAPSTITV